MRLRFTKMHGLGNDFVVIDAINQRVSLTQQQVKAITDRRFGVGCDQILIVETPKQADVDFNYRIYNHDGAEVENCGNGARCFAKFVRDRKLTGKSTIVVETCNGRMTLQVKDNGEISVNMGVPELSPELIPAHFNQRQISYSLSLGEGTNLEVGAVSMGNPHAVAIVNDVNSYPVDDIGAKVEAHSLFPNKVNAGFMSIIGSSEIDLRVFERGVGETLACGTGACAAVVVGRLQGLLNERVKVNLPGGALHIEWAGEGESVMMTGPATSVFHGQIKI